jgi:hypothetical protein
MSIGSVMFSSAVSVGTRLKDWKTKPTSSRRIRVSSSSESPLSSVSPIQVRPELGVSSPAMTCISVDLPDPDGPMIAVNAPAVNPTVIRSMATTRVSPSPYTLLRSRL